MFINPFVLPSSEYNRDLNLLKHYINDAATYLALMSEKTYDECLSFIKTSLRPGGKFQFTDPVISYLERDENGDRDKKEGTLLNYINDAIKEQDLIAPTLTTYLSPKRKQSLLVDFIDGNVKARGTAKKAMFKAKVMGDNLQFILKKIEQTNKKLNNNSISGAHVSASTPLYNKTAHSTLTSNCRSTSGYGNANNEKFLCGNRHYWSPDIVRNNIISIINNTNYAELEQTMQKYGIVHPSVEDTLNCIKYSTELYWHNKNEHKLIAVLVNKLSDIQRSAFVYTGDMFHLMKHNSNIIRTFITRLSSRIVAVHTNPKKIVDEASDDIKNLASQICSPELKGTSVRDIADKPEFHTYAATIENIQNVLDEYSDLIKTFWVTPNVPASMAFFPDSIRRAAITSDTDSTIFTVQDWVIWHEGKLGFDQSADAVAATMIFLASQTITHVLAIMSANFGIEEKRLFQIAMKNEFKFPVFVPTSVAKHYFALISCQEGNVFSDFEKEIKGVHLKSSNVPKKIIKEAAKMMEFIMHSVMEGKMVSINKMMKKIGDIEQEIVDSIRRGSYEYFRAGQIKSADSYKGGDSAAAYQQYLLWKEVFAPKYGETIAPPYMTVKVSTELDSPAKTKEWLLSLEDKELVKRIEDWMLKNGKKHIGSTFMLPEQCISSKGMPEEILAAVGIRRMILDCTNVMYIILETLGIYMLNKKITRLCVDIPRDKN